jgi:mono/diheme cytochrome c family protein
MDIRCWTLLIAIALPSAALAADADNGRDIAQRQCAPCHTVEPHQRREVAIAPPFDVIGRKSGFDADTLAYALLEPHPRMNFALTRREAIDVAAYISTLAR